MGRRGDVVGDGVANSFSPVLTPLRVSEAIPLRDITPFYVPNDSRARARLNRFLKRRPLRQSHVGAARPAVSVSAARTPLPNSRLIAFVRARGADFEFVTTTFRALSRYRRVEGVEDTHLLLDYPCNATRAKNSEWTKAANRRRDHR